MRYSRDLRARQPGGRRTLIQQALAILARYGSAANLYLPGVGAINGITAGNWLDSAGTTAATVDNPVGRVDNARGGVNLTQATTANKPILRLSGNVHSWQLDGSNDHFATGIATPSEGYYVGGALCTNTGATHTIGGGSGAGSDADAGIWIARQSTGNIRISVGNGTTRNSLLSQSAPINSTFVASAGWGLSSIFTGVNRVEVSATNSINCATSRPIYIGASVSGAATQYLPMVGHLYAQLWILGFTPTATERETLRQFIASLSGVAL